MQPMAGKLPSERSQSKEFPQPLGLGAAYRDFRLLFVVET
jgi:hypothetical protein